ncbi:adenylyltransferase and sulfurtransferase MOCS3 [Bombyx mandarina]|uniref:Adenylyltransferase and sulfurtransferase MOCS3 homolog n=1 Tax=Bombyx mandarina TaxID=7092 RepID=A0A6J2JJZ7_BOMMA|nr:adenylyltransferase and sulfurtransferase MOCS3 [Bombyx mandarina]
MDRVSVLETEISELRRILKEKENELQELKSLISDQQSSKELNNHSQPISDASKSSVDGCLPKWAIERYSRQILLSDIGVEGQVKICSAKVLIVGAGGLGCPAAMYLAGAGIGEIGIVDYDAVDLTNVHRQLLHHESNENTSKAFSAAESLRCINSKIKITPYNVQLDSKNAQQIASAYDLVLDCSDNVPTRYLLNDLCVMLKIPLISGSALKMEGQLTIYGYRRQDHHQETYIGPCYRCVFPTPPPPAAVGSCSAHGVAGPVPGTVGTLQALEAIKYVIGRTERHLLVGRMLLFDGEDATFRAVKLRPRRPACVACGDRGGGRLIDYEQFCNAPAIEKDLDLEVLPPGNRVSANELNVMMNNEERRGRHLVVDVRNEQEYAMCHIQGSVNYPVENLHRNLEELIEKTKEFDGVVFVCRRGNDSQVVAKKVLDVTDKERWSKVKDLVGGLHSWSKNVDPDFPVY